MRKRLTLSIFMLLMAVFVFGEEKNKAIEKIHLPKIETKLNSMKTEKTENSLDLKEASTLTIQNEVNIVENCYAGMTSCGQGYMFCQEEPLSGGDQLILWDAFESAYCP